jgi:hypothetical protein
MGKFRRDGRSQTAIDLSSALEKLSDPSYIITDFLGMGGTGIDTVATIDTTVFYNNSRPVLYLYGFHRTGANTFIAITAFCQFSIDRVYHKSLRT